MKNPTPEDLEIVDEITLKNIQGETVTIVIYSDKSMARVYN